MIREPLDWRVPRLGGRPARGHALPVGRATRVPATTSRRDAAATSYRCNAAATRYRRNATSPRERP